MSQLTTYSNNTGTSQDMDGAFHKIPNEISDQQGGQRGTQLTPQCSDGLGP